MVRATRIDSRAYCSAVVASVSCKQCEGNYRLTILMISYQKRIMMCDDGHCDGDDDDDDDDDAVSWKN